MHQLTQRAQQAARRDRLRADGLCYQCGDAPEPGKARCAKCIDGGKRSARNRSRRLRPLWRSLGICIACGARLAIPQQSRCAVCAEYQDEHKAGKRRVA